MDLRILVVICGGFILSAKSEINYLDCGSSFLISSVEVQNCQDTPCSISPGETRTVTVNARNIVPDIDDMESNAYLYLMGHVWTLSVTPNSPCPDWGCPLHESRVRTFKGDVQFPDSLIRRPAVLMLSTTYTTPSRNEVAFCVSLDVTFI